MAGEPAVAATRMIVRCCAGGGGGAWVGPGQLVVAVVVRQSLSRPAMMVMVLPIWEMPSAASRD
jgi:hypothetical protein